MKRVVIVFLACFLFAPLFADEKEVLAKARELAKQKEYAKALQVIDEGIKEVGLSQKLTRFKFSLLVDMKKYDQALIILNMDIEKNGESPGLLGQKMYVLMQQKKYKEALEVALKKDKISEKKSPWSCMDLVDIYLKLGKKDEVFTWLDEAVNRGFNDYNMLKDQAKESGLADDPRLDKLVVRIKKNIGLGKAAKDFTVKLLDGTPFQLSKHKGKVILVDFWATWCPPCVKEMPNLKQYYRDFNKRGFDIIGISLDSKEEALKKYIEKEKLPWRIAFSGKGWDDITADLYGVKSIPSYWLIDKKGSLRHFGLRKEALKKGIEELLAE